MDDSDASVLLQHDSDNETVAHEHDEFRYAITDYFVEKGHVLTPEMLKNRDFPEHFVYPEPYSVMSAGYIHDCDTVLDTIRQQHDTDLAHSCSDLHVMEVRLRWPDSNTTSGSLFRLEIHMRIAMVSDGKELKTVREVWPKGWEVSDEFDEHWLRMKKGQRRGRVQIWKYHTHLRDRLHTEGMDEDELTFALDNAVPIDIDTVLWQQLFNKPSKRTASASVLENAGFMEIEDNFEVLHENLRFDKMACKYYQYHPKLNAHTAISNFIVKEIVQIIEYTEVYGDAKAAYKMELSCCLNEVCPITFVFVS